MPLDEDYSKPKLSKNHLILGIVAVVVIIGTILIFQSMEEPKEVIDREEIFQSMNPSRPDLQLPVDDVYPTEINFFEVYKCDGETTCNIQFNMEVYFSNNEMILVQGFTPDELQNNILDAKYNKVATEQMLDYMWNRLDITHQEDFWEIYNGR